MQQRPEGTINHCETITLMRDAPFGLGWLMRGFITGVPPGALQFALAHVRAGLVSEAPVQPRQP